MRCLATLILTLICFLGTSAQEKNDEVVSVYSDSVFLDQFFYSNNLLLINSTIAEITKKDLLEVERSKVLQLIIDLKFVEVVEEYSEKANYFLLEQYYSQINK